MAEPGIGVVADVTRRQEEDWPLDFVRAHVCLHLLVKAGERKTNRRQTRSIGSYERDMLAYAFRDNPPFVTYQLPNLGPLTAEFPEHLRFVSEDEQISLECPPKRTRLELDVLAHVTQFVDSRIRVLHLALRPNPDERRMSVYDLVKLVKLWEGGERVVPTVRFAAGGVALDSAGFDVAAEDPEDPRLATQVRDTLSALVRWALGDEQAELLDQPAHRSDAGPGTRPSGYCVGTLDLLLDNGLMYEFSQTVRQFVTEPGAYARFDLPESGRVGPQRHAAVPFAARWRMLVAVGGLLQGLLDFPSIAVDELHDVYLSALDAREWSAPAPHMRQQTLVALHKGTLLSVGPLAKRSAEWSTWVSPYLLLPHAIALHNQERIRTADRIAQTALLARPERPNAGDGSSSSSSTADDAADPSTAAGYRSGSAPTVGQARQRLTEAQEAVDQFIPNIFHYPSERALYDKCHTSRAITDLRQEVKDALPLSREVLDNRERRHALVLLILGITLSVLATLEGYLLKTDQVFVRLPADFALASIPAVLYVCFFLWRRHH
jgi:hypothetical protein